MVRFAAVALTTTALLMSTGCKEKQQPRAQTLADEAIGLASMIHTADPRSEPQLLSGFYGVENNSWRWAGPRFSVNLRPPANAAQDGATLLLKFTIPDVVINQLKSMTLSSTVNGTKLEPETYTRSGEQSYSRDVPASLLHGNAARVDFSFDKALPPSPTERRDLAAIVTIVGFEARQ